MASNYEIYQEINADFKKKNNNKKNAKYKYFLILILMFVFSIPFIVLSFMKSYENIYSFDSIWQPVQISTSWWTIIHANWDIVNVDFLAEYDIKWRVLATAQYWDNIFQKTQVCGNCWELNLIQNLYCTSCGENLHVSCRECQSKYSRSYSYCPNCGAPRLEE